MSHFFRFTYKKIVSLTQRINNTALGRRKMATQGLQKIRVIPNKNYRRSGTKSYVWLMNKWGFEPTMPGPYFMMNKIVQQGHPGVLPQMGGNAQQIRVLAKQIGSAQGQTG